MGGAFLNFTPFSLFSKRIGIILKDFTDLMTLTDDCVVVIVFTQKDNDNFNKGSLLILNTVFINVYYN